VLGAAAAVLALVAGAALALAMSASTVSSAPSSRLGERIVVSPQGRTLYALSPETVHHLLCKSGECLKFWPPLTVSSRKARLTDGSGVHGGLGVLRRSDGLLQVTLRGMPLYRFSGDHAKGQVNGQGLKSFGGTWHAVTAAADPAHSPSSTEPASGTPGGSSGSSGSSGGGGYESPGPSTSTTTSTKTSTTPTSTTKEEKTTPKEEKTAPKEEKTTPKESQAEKEAREKREKEEQEKSKKEYCERYPHYPGCP
jgi:predicted lipoprotein with Yx(FWY)xxD motif